LAHEWNHPVSSIDFVRQLDKQLRYIETSAREYDAGDKDEAIRIATSLRVIFHQTPSSTSLLTHLQARYTRILSSADGPPYKLFYLPMGQIQGSFHVPEHTSKNCSHYEPIRAVGVPSFIPWLDKRILKRQVQSPDWWAKEPAIILHGKKAHRKDVVLWASNKDGGAHVDEHLPADYLHLSDCLRVHICFPGAETDGIEMKPADVHFALLRQIAHEVLKSTEILKLAGRSKGACLL
jgi:hypothetical protein